MLDRNSEEIVAEIKRRQEEDVREIEIVRDVEWVKNQIVIKVRNNEHSSVSLQLNENELVELQKQIDITLRKITAKMDF